MAMADLGTNSNGSPVSLADIAERQEISLSYLEQLFGKLRKAGIVKSVRGPGGGYLMARENVRIRVSDIILAVDEPLTATRCSNSGSEGCRNDKSRCLTHDLWQSLSHQIYLYLNSITLEDVCEGNVPGSRPDTFIKDDHTTFAAE